MTFQRRLMTIPPVLRRALLAVVCFASLCAALAYLASVSADVAAASRAGIAVQTDQTGSSEGSGPEWHAQEHAPASLTESTWKLRHLHAEVTSTGDSRAVAAPSPARRTVNRRSLAPHHLLHIPLLI